MFWYTSSTYADEKLTLDGDAIEKTAKLLCLRDVLSSVGRVQEAMTARLRFGWKKLKDIANVTS